MVDAIEKLVDGDIFRWSYKAADKLGSWDSYHCCSRIGIVEGGRLYDTYWTYGLKANSGSGRSFGNEDLHRIELKLLANVSDLESAKKYEADYYDDADIVDLTHPNGGSFHLRKGATRSQAKMLASARAKLEASMSDERVAAHRSQRLREVIDQIEAGDIGTYI